MAAHWRDDVLVTTDDQPVTLEPAPPEPSGRFEVPERDGIEQSVEVDPGWRVGRPSTAFDAPEGDALEQAIEAPGESDRPETRSPRGHGPGRPEHARLGFATGGSAGVRP